MTCSNEEVWRLICGTSVVWLAIFLSVGIIFERFCFDRICILKKRIKNLGHLNELQISNIIENSNRSEARVGRVQHIEYSNVYSDNNDKLTTNYNNSNISNINDQTNLVTLNESKEEFEDSHKQRINDTVSITAFPERSNHSKQGSNESKESRESTETHFRRLAPPKGSNAGNLGTGVSVVVVTDGANNTNNTHNSHKTHHVSPHSAQSDHSLISIHSMRSYTEGSRPDMLDIGDIGNICGNYNNINNKYNKFTGRIAKLPIIMQQSHGGTVYSPDYPMNSINNSSNNTNTIGNNVHYSTDTGTNTHDHARIKRNSSNVSDISNNTVNNGDNGCNSSNFKITFTQFTSNYSKYNVTPANCNVVSNVSNVSTDTDHNDTNISNMSLNDTYNTYNTHNTYDTQHTTPVMTRNGGTTLSLGSEDAELAAIDAMGGIIDPTLNPTIHPIDTTTHGHKEGVTGTGDEEENEEMMTVLTDEYFEDTNHLNNDISSIPAPAPGPSCQYLTPNNGGVNNDDGKHVHSRQSTSHYSVSSYSTYDRRATSLNSLSSILGLDGAINLHITPIKLDEEEKQINEIINKTHFDKLVTANNQKNSPNNNVPRISMTGSNHGHSGGSSESLSLASTSSNSNSNSNSTRSNSTHSTVSQLSQLSKDNDYATLQTILSDINGTQVSRSSPDADEPKISKTSKISSNVGKIEGSNENKNDEMEDKMDGKHYNICVNGNLIKSPPLSTGHGTCTGSSSGACAGGNTTAMSGHKSNNSSCGHKSQTTLDFTYNRYNNHGRNDTVNTLTTLDTLRTEDVENSMLTGDEDTSEDTSEDIAENTADESEDSVHVNKTNRGNSGRNGHGTGVRSRASGQSGQSGQNGHIAHKKSVVSVMSVMSGGDHGIGGISQQSLHLSRFKDLDEVLTEHAQQQSNDNISNYNIFHNRINRSSSDRSKCNSARESLYNDDNSYKYNFIDNNNNNNSQSNIIGNNRNDNRNNRSKRSLLKLFPSHSAKMSGSYTSVHTATTANTTTTANTGNYNNMEDMRLDSYRDMQLQLIDDNNENNNFSTNNVLSPKLATFLSPSYSGAGGNKTSNSNEYNSNNNNNNSKTKYGIKTDSARLMLNDDLSKSWVQANTPSYLESTMM